MRRAAFALAAIGAIGAAATAEEIGTAIQVQPQVRAFPPGAPSRELVERNPIERGLTVRLTGRDAFLEVAYTREFDCKQQPSLSHGRISGVLTFLGPGDAALGDRSLPCKPMVAIRRGKAKIAQRPGELVVDVDTPDSVTKVKGTYARFLVDPFVGTFVGVDEGVVSVQANAGGDPVEVAAGHWVLVPPGGLPTRPAPLQALEESEDSPLKLFDFSTRPPGRPPP